MVDERIIHDAQRGDPAAQRALYEAHYAAAFRLAYLFLQNPGDAEEVVQDAFVYLLRNLDRYDGEKGTFWAWLRVTLVSRCRNKRRRQQPPLVSLEGMEATGRFLVDPNAANDPARALENRGARRAIWQALQQVSEGAREAIILRFYEGLAYADIARILDCSPEAARARVAHGKLQLRRLLDEGEERRAPQGHPVETARAAG
ncbi:MAG: RNA polymerase sigma factor [Anaerolineae bacterium]|nr:RNA polymerase sigma factor [Anaerolineae bacterium]